METLNINNFKVNNDNISNSFDMANLIVNYMKVVILKIDESMDLQDKSYETMEPW